MQNQGGSCDSKVGPDAAVFCEAEQLQIGEGSALAADWKPPEHWIPPNLLRRARFRAPRLPWVAETRQPLDRPRAQRNLRRSAVVPLKKPNGEVNGGVSGSVSDRRKHRELRIEFYRYPW